VWKYRMQNCKLWRSQILQSMLDNLCTYNTKRLKILETGGTDAILSACGSNGDFCCVPSIMIDWIQVMKLLPEFIFFPDESQRNFYFSWFEKHRITQRACVWNTSCSFTVHFVGISWEAHASTRGAFSLCFWNISFIQQ